MFSIKNVLKYSLLLAMVAFLATAVDAQDDKSKRKSPPMETTGTVGDVTVAINYGAPSVNGRTIFGDLEPWDETWRTGANEATTFEVSKAVKIEGEDLPAGKYSLFTIPREDGNWTVIFNSVADQWGDYNYDESKDVLRVDVEVMNSEDITEQMKIDLEEDGEASKVIIKWDHTHVPFTVESGAM